MLVSGKSRFFGTAGIMWPRCGAGRSLSPKPTPEHTFVLADAILADLWRFINTEAVPAIR